MFRPCPGPFGDPGLLTTRAPAASAMLGVESVEPSSKRISSSCGRIAARSAFKHPGNVASALYAGTITETASRTGPAFRMLPRGLEPAGAARHIEASDQARPPASLPRDILARR